MISLTVEQINEAIQQLTNEERPQITDGYHTFDELYDHRCVLFAALVTIHPGGWKSKLHSDATSYAGWFIAGIGKKPGEQITYHLPMSLWMNCRCFEFPKAPEFDGHKSDDVLLRLKNL